MNSKNLLTQLSDLETSLNNFSFEELTSEEASRLQKSFQKFKLQLEGKVWGEEPRPTDGQEDKQSGNLPDNADDLRALARACNQMRTPLNGIIGLADMLVDGRLNEEQEYQVRSLQETGQNLLNMVVEVTEFSSLLAGLENFENVNFNFHNLIDDVEYLCRTLIVDKSQELKVQLDPAIPGKLQGDPSKLSQILLHLLGISVNRDFDGNISFDVQFQHKEEEKVFLEFVISSQRRLGGITLQAPSPLGIQGQGQNHGNNCLTSLGLPIVNQIVQKLGGELYVQDDSSLSATYAFRLPFTVASEGVESKPGPKPLRILRGLRILAIEKNPVNQQIIARRCRSWGCSPYVTASALDAERMLNDAIDLLLVDVPDENEDVMTLVKRIRGSKSPAIKNLPVIGLISGKAHDTRDVPRATGFDDFLIKPYSAEELQQKLMQYHKRIMVRNKRLSVLSQPAGTTIPANNIALEQVFEDCLGRMETLEELVVLFKQKMLEFIGSVKLHLDRSDFKGIEYACQKVSGSLKLFGAGGLMELVDQINRGCGNNPDPLHLRFLHHCFIEEYPQVEEAVDNAMLALKRRNK